MLLSPETLARAKEIYESPSNFPEFELNNIRIEIQRLTLVRNNAIQNGASPLLVAQFNHLVALNAELVQLGEQPVNHADLLQMWRLHFTIRYAWAQLNIIR